MAKVIHLKTKRVSGHRQDKTQIDEVITIKLMVGANFNNFLKHIALKGYIKSKPPVVEKALESSTKNGKTIWKEIDTKPYQAQVDAALEGVTGTKAVDYKAIAEKQSTDIAKLMDLLEAKGITLGEGNEGNEGDEGELSDPGADFGQGDGLNPIIVAKAVALGLAYPANIKNETLLKKIQDIEPDFTV